MTAFLPKVTCFKLYLRSTLILLSLILIIFHRFRTISQELLANGVHGKNTKKLRTRYHASMYECGYRQDMTSGVPPLYRALCDRAKFELARLRVFASLCVDFIHFFTKDDDPTKSQAIESNGTRYTITSSTSLSLLETTLHRLD
jgi:hypothetical protein